LELCARPGLLRIRLRSSCANPIGSLRDRRVGLGAIQQLLPECPRRGACRPWAGVGIALRRAAAERPRSRSVRWLSCADRGGARQQRPVFRLGRPDRGCRFAPRHARASQSRKDRSSVTASAVRVGASISAIRFETPPQRLLHRDSSTVPKHHSERGRYRDQGSVHACQATGAAVADRSNLAQPRPPNGRRRRGQRGTRGTWLWASSNRRREIRPGDERRRAGGGFC